MNPPEKNRKLHILFIGPALGVHAGYVPSPVESLMPLLEDRGYECVSTSSKLHRVSRVLDMICTTIKTSNWSDVISLQIYAYRSFIVEDLISWLAKRMKKRIIMVLHFGDFPNFIKRFPRWSKRVLGRAEKIIAPSGFLKKAVEELGFPVQVIPNVIPIDNYHFVQRSTISPKILWMRSFFRYYNPVLAVETLKCLREKYPHATLTMAGKDKGLESVVIQYAHELGLLENIRFPGFFTMEIKQQEFSKHDIFINTNEIENFGISIVEAAAFGLPIVATNVGGIPYLFTDEENALIVPPNDPVAMASAIIRIIEEPGLASRLSLGGRNLAESCSPEIVIPLWEETLSL